MPWHRRQGRPRARPPAPQIQPQAGPTATHLPQRHLRAAQVPGEQQQGAEQHLLLQWEGVLGPPATPGQPVPKHLRNHAGDVQESHTFRDGGCRGVTCGTERAAGDLGGICKGCGCQHRAGAPERDPGPTIKASPEVSPAGLWLRHCSRQQLLTTRQRLEQGLAPHLQLHHLHGAPGERQP